MKGEVDEDKDQNVSDYQSSGLESHVVKRVIDHLLDQIS